MTAEEVNNETEVKEAEIAEKAQAAEPPEETVEEQSETPVVDESPDVEEESTDAKPAAPTEPTPTPENEAMKWYVVHTYSGYEHKAKLALEERIRNLKSGQGEKFGEIVVPEENVIELVKGKKRTSKRRFFPGYILVKMDLTNETWHVVKDTPKVTGFVGNKNNPVPVPESEVQKMTNRIAEGEAKPRPRITFVEGETVRVVDGPFSNFNGVVEEVNMDKGKVRVSVSIFGRATPVELDFIQVEKI